MSYRGFYINLDRCPERRAEIEAQLARYGLAERYRRFPAAAGNTLGLPGRLNDGEAGCFLSHYLLMKENLGAGEHIHAVEDDTVFAAGTAGVLDRIIADGAIDRYDILFTDIALPLTNDAFREFKVLYDRIVARDAAGAIKGAAFQILGLSPHMAPTTGSFLVNKNSIGKLYDLYDGEVRQGLRTPIDALLFQKIRAGEIRAGIVFPFVTAARIGRTLDSAVRRVPDSSLRFTAANLARYSFFIGCDREECRQWLERLPMPDANDGHARLLEKILAFSLTDGTAQKPPP